MPRYKPSKLQQDAFVPICFNKQIHPGTFEYALHQLIEHKVDLSAFDAHYDNDNLGARAYHSKVLVNTPPAKSRWLQVTAESRIDRPCGR